jgi:hypothetical protein
MQMKSIPAAAAALAGLLTVNLDPSAAFGADLDRAGAKKRGPHHAAYSRYAHVFPEDPYTYRYEPRGYYPYYRSDYWRPTPYVLYRNRVHYNVWNTRPPQFRFYQSWGYPVRTWRHKEWHADHHGRHRPWHW